MSIQAVGWAIKQKIKDPEAKLLLICIANYADDKDRGWPSRSSLVKDTSMSESTVKRRLKVLADLGLITSRKEGLHVYYRALPEKLACYLEYRSLVGQPLAAKVKRSKAR